MFTKNRLTRDRRSTLFALAGMLAYPISDALAASGQAIRLLVGGPTGGMEDTVARAAAQMADKALGQSIYVENRTGAGGTPAFLALKRSPPDGSTLALATLSILRQPILEDVGYDALKDFTYISALTDVVFCVVVPANSPFKKWEDLLAFGKQKPEAVSYGCPAGLGNSAHLFGEEIASRERVKWTAIPFRGSSDTMTSLLGDQLTFSVDTLISAAPMMEAGKVRILAFASDVAPKAWTHIPTFRQLGYDLSIDNFIGIAGPAGMDPALVARLDKAFKSVTEQPEFAAFLQKRSQRPLYMDHAALNDYVRRAERGQREILTKYGLAKVRS